MPRKWPGTPPGCKPSASEDTPLREQPVSIAARGRVTAPDGVGAVRPILPQAVRMAKWRQLARALFDPLVAEVRAEQGVTRGDTQGGG